MEAVTLGGCPMMRGEYMYFDRAFGAHLYVYTDLFGRVWAAPGPFSFLSRRRAVFDMQGFWEIYDPKWHGDLSADERE